MSSTVRRTAAIAAAYLAVLYIHGVAIALGERRLSCATHAPLYDVVHNLQASGNVWALAFTRINTDWIVFALSAAVVAALIVHPQRQIVFRRFLVFHGVLAAIRSLAIWVTTIPSPNPMCRGRVMAANPFERALSLSFDAIGIPHEWLGLGAGGITCCDIVISGHAAVLVVDAMLIGMAFRSTSIRVAAWCLAAVGLASAIGVTRHYTVEIVITTVLATLVITSYRLAVRAGVRGAVAWIEQADLFGPFTAIPAASVIQSPRGLSSVDS
jgi:hypothetical protein